MVTLLLEDRNTLAWVKIIQLYLIAIPLLFSYFWLSVSKTKQL